MKRKNYFKDIRLGLGILKFFVSKNLNALFSDLQIAMGVESAQNHNLAIINDGCGIRPAIDHWPALEPDVSHRVVLLHVVESCVGVLAVEAAQGVNETVEDDKGQEASGDLHVGSLFPLKGVQVQSVALVGVMIAGHAPDQVDLPAQLNHAAVGQWTRQSQAVAAHIVPDLMGCEERIQ